tara:strand:- start:19777 stop:20649 length:873 start_codon:yes stop_codon:yes gene_type:complete
MSTTTRVASVAMHSAMGDPDTNLDRVAQWSHKARDQGATFALFPEECVTGSMNKSDIPPDDAMRIAREASEKTTPFLESLCRDLGLTLVVGTIEPASERYRNSALIVGPSGRLATFTKLHIPNETERRWFEPGTDLPVVTSQGWTFGVGICYDLRFPEIFRTAAQRGADFFLLAVGASGGSDKVTPEDDQTAQAALHRQLAAQVLPARAIDNGLYVFYANQAGKSGRAWFPGLAFAIDPDGRFIHEHAPDEGMIVTEVSREVIDKARSSGCFTANEARPDVYAAPLIVGK